MTIGLNQSHFELKNGKWFSLYPLKELDSYLENTDPSHNYLGRKYVLVFERNRTCFRTNHPPI